MVIAVGVMLIVGRADQRVRRAASDREDAGAELPAADRRVARSAKGSGQHIPKGYIYFAMGFSVFVEMINIRVRAQRQAGAPALEVPRVTPIVRTIATTTHGRYFVAAPATPPVGVLVGFHGYAEDAEVHLAALQDVPGVERWLVVAVQALHPFYTREQRIVANWMKSLVQICPQRCQLP